MITLTCTTLQIQLLFVYISIKTICHSVKNNFIVTLWNMYLMYVLCSKWSVHYHCNALFCMFLYTCCIFHVSWTFFFYLIIYYTLVLHIFINTYQRSTRMMFCEMIRDTSMYYCILLLNKFLCTSFLGFISSG